MALLAERKRKAKFGLDPQNFTWSNDSSKFGQRLLEKMGWEKGKGLGANENGITEHIKASYKSDTKGLGCTPQTADAWIAHQDDFNDLLKMLNSQSEAEAPVEKTEKEKRLDGHKRYYGRFARGQVQTLRSTEDLNCIFGRRKAKPEIAEPNTLPSSDHGDTEDEKSHGLKTVTSTSSVQEYFAKKMAELKARKNAGIEPDISTTLVDNEVAEGEIKKENKSSLYSAVNFSYSGDVNKTSSESVITNETDCEKNCRGWYNPFVKDSCSDVIQNVVVEEKSKKKKRKKEKHNSEDNDSNSEVRTSSKKEKVRLKDKHKTIADSLLSENSYKDPDSLELPPPVSGDEEEKELLNKKKKERKAKNKSSSADIEYTNDNDERSEKKKKNKNRKIHHSDQLSSISGDENELSNKKKERKTKYTSFNVDGGDQKSERKNKSKKIHPSEDVIDNENVDSSAAKHNVKKFDNDTNANSIELSTKKKVTFRDYDDNEKHGQNNCDSVGVTSESDGQKKKQKRKHSQIDADEISEALETNTKKSKKKRKDASAPEENASGEMNKGCDNFLSDEQKIIDNEEGNKVTTDIIHSPQKLKKHNRKMAKKERKLKRKLKEDKQNARSNLLFLGSNIADIVGYGLSQLRKSGKSKNAL